MAKAYAYVVSVLMLGAVLAPALRDPTHDTFPLSTYPMFAQGRARVVHLTSALALGAGGFERPLAPRLIGSAETMQAQRILTHSLRAGPEQAQALCHAIAARVAWRAPQALAPAQHVALVTQAIDVLAYARGDRLPRHRHIHIHCPIPRGPS